MLVCLSNYLRENELSQSGKVWKEFKNFKPFMLFFLNFSVDSHPHRKLFSEPVTSPRRQVRTPPRLLELSRILTMKKVRRAKYKTRAQKAAQKIFQEETKTQIRQHPVTEDQKDDSRKSRIVIRR